MYTGAQIFTLISVSVFVFSVTDDTNNSLMTGLNLVGWKAFAIFSYIWIYFYYCSDNIKFEYFNF